MITALIILAIFIGVWVGIYHMIKDSLAFFPAIFIVMMGCMLYFSIKDYNETKHCLETVQPIIPRIVHLEDSSKKILKYQFEGEEHWIEIDRTSNNFYVPESLLKIEPCNRTVFVKR